MWSKGEHKRALAFVIKLGTELGVTGRGRCAAEGANPPRYAPPRNSLLHSRHKLKHTFPRC